MTDPTLDAEQAVIAGVMVSNGRVLDDITLTGVDFLDGRYGEIFDTLRAMNAEGKPVDQTSAAMAMPKHAVFLWECTTNMPHMANTAYHAELVQESAVRRRVAVAGERVREWSADLPMGDLAERSRKEIDDALGVQKRKVRFLSESIGETIDGIGKPSPAMRTPWMALDDTIGGFRPGALYVVGARPGVGKTAVSIQIALSLAVNGAVAYSSLEMPERELHLRCISVGAWVPHAMLEAPSPLPDWAAVKVASWWRDTEKPIAFDDRGSVTVNDVRAHARSVSRVRPLAGVVVDYLQLLSGVSGAKRLEIVTEASRQLKLLARDLECPVVALSQLNRNSESRVDKRPALSDLRESGSIEQDADVVILLHRDMESRAADADEFDMLVAKNRHGPTRALQMRWHGQFMAVLDQ